MVLTLQQFDNESIGGDSLSINRYFFPSLFIVTYSLTRLSYASVGAPLPEYVLQFNRDYLNLGEDRRINILPSFDMLLIGLELYVPSDHVGLGSQSVCKHTDTAYRKNQRGKVTSTGC